MSASQNLSTYQFGENKGAEGLSSSRFTIHVGDIPRIPDTNSRLPMQFSTPLPYPHLKPGDRTSRLYLVDNDSEPNTDQRIIHSNKTHSNDLIAKKIVSAVDVGSMAPNFIFSSQNAKKDSDPVPNPNSSHPKMKAYIDYSHQGDNQIYIHMMRSEQSGYHHTRNLAMKLAEMYPNHTINFGQMQNPYIAKIKDELESKGHKVEGRENF